MNSVNLIGSLTEPPRLESDAAGDRCALRLAVRRRRRGGRPTPGVVYVDVVALGADARECAQRLTEGARVGVSGLVEVDEWRDAEGTWRTRQDIVADAVEFLDRPGEARERAEGGEAGEGGEAEGGRRGQGERRPRKKPSPRRRRPRKSDGG